MNRQWLICAAVIGLLTTGAAMIGAKLSTAQTTEPQPKPPELVAVHVYGSSPVGFDEAVQAGIVRLQADGKKVEEFSVQGFGGSVHGGKIEYLVSIRGLVKDVREESKASRYSP